MNPRGFSTATILAGGLLLSACGPATDSRKVESRSGARPSILLVTLDTTRADAVGPEAKGVTTPAFNALAARGRRFLRAYATVPETLPSHTSMMTGLYPAGHGIHENARTIPASQSVLAEKLREAGYETSAFVSSFVLAHRFGLARGFEVYDDIENPERSAKETTDRAVAHLSRASAKPRFLWVHYFDAHTPYAPAEPFRSKYEKAPYLGEIAATDEQLGRLIAEFERTTPEPRAILVLGDHGEGLGEHGEKQHGLLLYDGTMRVPFVIAGPEVPIGSSSAPVSTRRVFNTVLDFAGLDKTGSLRAASVPAETVLGEAMKPFLEYGWQPQVFATDAQHKAISAGRVEVYDTAADPGESRDLAPGTVPSREIRNALRDYPVPSPGAARGLGAMSEEDRRKLASLGYVSAGAAPVVRTKAPRPADMIHLFDDMERASSLFVRDEFEAAIPLLRKVLDADPNNLDAMLRLATSYSALGRDALAIAAFDRAKALAPDSADVRAYLGLHLARGARWPEAIPMLERAEAEFPDRLPLVEALARLREREHRSADAIGLWARIHALRAPKPGERARVGLLAMDIENTPLAIQAFEDERARDPKAFTNNLELGVLYLSERRFEDARDALDRVSPRHPAYPMALFKRAQVSVLLKEPDQTARIEAARRAADATTRALIEREKLFQPNRGQ